MDDSAQTLCRKPLLSTLPGFQIYVFTTNILPREQMQNARENPLAAAGGAPTAQQQANAENLLDIDFDGAAPASAEKEPPSGMSGLEGLAGTPVRTGSPAVPAPQQSNNLDDLLGVFGNDNAAALGGLSGGFGDTNDDLMNGFSSLNLAANSNPTSPGSSSNGKKTNEDILSLF
jgi:AP-1 complex subunit beta-1